MPGKSTKSNSTNRNGGSRKDDSDNESGQGHVELFSSLMMGISNGIAEPLVDSVNKHIKKVLKSRKVTMDEDDKFELTGEEVMEMIDMVAPKGAKKTVTKKEIPEDERCSGTNKDGSDCKLRKQKGCKGMCTRHFKASQEDDDKPSRSSSKKNYGKANPKSSERRRRDEESDDDSDDDDVPVTTRKRNGKKPKDDSDDEDDKPVNRRNNRKPKDDDSDEEEEEDKPKKGKKDVKKDDKKKDPKKGGKRPPTESDDEDEDEEDDKPKKGSSKSKKDDDKKDDKKVDKKKDEKKKPEPESDDDDDEEEEKFEVESLWKKGEGKSKKRSKLNFCVIDGVKLVLTLDDKVKKFGENQIVGTLDADAEFESDDDAIAALKSLSADMIERIKKHPNLKTLDINASALPSDDDDMDAEDENEAPSDDKKEEKKDKKEEKKDDDEEDGPKKDDKKKNDRRKRKDDDDEDDE